MKQFEILTKRDMIRRVLDRWATQYANIRVDDRYNFYPKETLRKLQRLDLETATEEDIEKIIGNRAWTELECNICHNDVQKLIHFNDTEYFKGICEECIDKMAATIKGGIQ